MKSLFGGAFTYEYWQQLNSAFMKVSLHRVNNEEVRWCDSKGLSGKMGHTLMRFAWLKSCAVLTSFLFFNKSSIQNGKGLFVLLNILWLHLLLPLRKFNKMTQVCWKGRDLIRTPKHHSFNSSLFIISCMWCDSYCFLWWLTVQWPNFPRNHATLSSQRHTRATCNPGEICTPQIC